MNVDINKPKAGLITIIDSPGGRDELEYIVVTPDLFHEILEVVEKPIKSGGEIKWDSWEISRQIMNLLWVDDKKSPRVLHTSNQQSWVYFNTDFLNKYEFIGTLPIETY